MRSRNIKPGFFENEKLAELPPLTRLLYIGLWCYADREGRFEWRPKRIKAVILPYDDCDIDAMLMSLHVMTFIDMYETSTGTIGCIPKFKEHQNPHPHEAKSRLPEKCESNQCHGMSLHVSDMSVGCNADSLIPDSLIPIIKPPLPPKGDGGEKTPPVEPPAKKKRAPKAELPFTYSEDFERAWAAYPRKTNKGDAWKAWEKAIKRDMPVHEIVERINSRAASHDWTKEERRYVPHMATWLNKNGWEDEAASVSGPTYVSPFGASYARH